MGILLSIKAYVSVLNLMDKIFPVLSVGKSLKFADVNKNSIIPYEIDPGFG